MNTKTVVKVCGITDMQEAKALDDMGIDYLGFNFYPQSKRYIEPEKAKRIIENLQYSKAVGVFVQEARERIQAIFKESQLSWVQLHGGETSEFMQNLNLQTIKAIGVSQASDIPTLPVEGCQRLLFDTKDETHFGGTGRSFNWNLLKKRDHGQEFLIAGGLGPQNLKEAVELSAPWGVDLNSQVEDSPGKKNLALIEKCLKILGR